MNFRRRIFLASAIVVTLLATVVGVIAMALVVAGGA